MCEARSITPISNSHNAEPLVATQEDRWVPKSAEVVVLESPKEAIEWGFTTTARSRRSIKVIP